MIATEINRNLDVLCAGAQTTLISSANFDSTHTHAHTHTHAVAVMLSLLRNRLPSMNDFRCVRRCWRRCNCKLYVTRCCCCCYCCLHMLQAHTYVHIYIHTYIHVHVYVCSYFAALNSTCHICALPDVAPAPEEDALWPLLTS